MGIVLDAEDAATGREVAIKVLRDSLADHQVVRARFAREAPENLFLLREPDGQLGQGLKLLDFGIAKCSDSAEYGAEEQILASDEASMGTTVYMAPEQFRAPPEVDERADLWAVGVILYELLTGRLPFDGATRAQTMMRILADDAAPPSTHDAAIFPELDRVVMRCLRRDPAERFQSATELDAALAPMTLVGSTWSPKERTPRASLVRMAAREDRRRRTTARVA